jgi:hypothetical protein
MTPLVVFCAALWLVFLGPLWLLGSAVLHATKHLNQAASLWCRFLMKLFPEDL